MSFHAIRAALFACLIPLLSLAAPVRAAGAAQQAA